MLHAKEARVTMQGGQPVDNLLQPADSAETWQIAANQAFAAAASPNLVRC
jgi:hypothetical protein